MKYNKKELTRLIENIENETNKPNLLLDDIKKIQSISSHGDKLHTIEIDESLTKINELVSLAEKIIADNQKDSWDIITVKNDIKQLDNSKKILYDSINQFKTMQQRMIGAYDDIIFKLSRYFDFNKNKEDYE